MAFFATTSYAATDMDFQPTKFSTKYNQSTNSYTITGFDTIFDELIGMGEGQKKNIAIVIPDSYNGNNGAWPVTLYNILKSEYLSALPTSLD